MPALYFVRSVFENEFNYRLQAKNGKTYSDVTAFAPLEPLFMESLKGLLQELFDPEMPFAQTKDVKKCQFCAYAGVCQRGGV